MAKLVVAQYLTSITSLLFLLSHAKGNQIISSCSQTPYPNVCNSFISDTLLSSKDQYSHFNFRDMALQATVDRAKQAHQLALAVDLNSLDALAKVAWTDCLELSESTLSHLNHIVGSTTNTISTEDIQTWLSAALANQQTCKNGFIEMGLGSHLITITTILV
ncbi:putative pectinesterase/pectinesterase inhibitor 6 [Acorus gramineus]|uniref:Pectinesterase/pectinesterase inhibitor 6 n=1 Tax=Acorus gramineus TaxID=55184 RepID=A0AAV9BM96_ACOGR|nr:putative pectinesterase/pectinesterase inhibitor 6 [Acorus gramineus]